ncbi:MAG: methionine aminotransferase [Sphingobacteriales bacterium]|jgi:methionine aminotransferase
MPFFPNHLKSKLPKVGTTVFSIMSKLAIEHDAINLSQGFPDFDCDPELLRLANKYMEKGYNQYAPMPGIIGLRLAIHEKVKHLYSMGYDPEKEITITSGATQAIFTAISAVINEDDEVIIFEPAYDCYGPAVELNGGIPIYIEMEAPEYSINWENVKRMVSGKTKMIIINSPHNPTGATLNKSDMEQLIKITADSEIIILSDEVYEHVIFDGKKHLSVSMYPELADRSFVVASFGKVFHITGWKMGYCLGPSNLMAEFRKIHQYNVFSSNTPLQYALAEYLENKEHYLSLPSFFTEKRDTFLKEMKSSRFNFIPTNGSYFVLADYSKISDESDMQFCSRMTIDTGVAAIPVSSFYSNGIDNKVIRFCFAKKDETLIEAAKLLCKI